MPTKMCLHLKQKTRIHEPPGLAGLTLIPQVDLLGFCVGSWLTWGEQLSMLGSAAMSHACFHLIFASAAFSLFFPFISQTVNEAKMCFLFISLEEKCVLSLSLLREAWHSYEWHGSSVSFIRLASPECHHGFFCELLVKIFYFKLCVFCDFIFIVQGS